MSLFLLSLGAAALPTQDPGGVPAAFREFCWDCHGDGSKKGGFAIDGYRGLEAMRADRKRWGKAVLLLQSHVMPPLDKPQPSAAQRRALLEWIDGAVFPVDPERPDPGHSALRRLNRAEYDNAVRDLFRIESRPADAFPADDSGYGFDTVGDVLSLSPALLEKMMAAARQVVDEATLPRAVGQAGIERLGPQLEVFRGEAPKDGGAILLQDGEVGVHAELRADAVYRVLIQAASAGGARVDVLCDGERVHTFDVDAPWKPGGRGFKTCYALVPLAAGRRRISLRVANPGEGRVAAIQAFKFRGPFNPVSPTPPPFLVDLLGPERATAVPRLTLSGEDLDAGEGKSSLDTGAAWFSTNGFRRTPLSIREPGRYRFRVKAGAQQVGPERVKFELRVGGKTLGPLEVSMTEQRPEWIEVETALEAGTPELQVWFVNAFRDEATKAERLLWIHEFTLDGPLRATEAPVDVPALLARVARRLYRRPLRPGEAERLGELARRGGQPPLAALRTGLTALLVSPSFLYWNPPAPAGPVELGSVAIDELALASRLGAFLWSSVPDEELLRLAESGRLRESFRVQVARMLADPKARALTENFAGQWLELRNMALVRPDPAAFPGWTVSLAADLRRETELLFEHVLREDRPVPELLTADYTFANARVAAHYGIPGVEGDAFRRVPAARAGILGHASILTFTSHPNRTSPVKRGKFVLEKILGTPPPPAPADVPPLPEDAPEVRELTMRQRLEKHRSNKACASCHAFMDPVGFAFERYDPVGRRREGDVDAGGKLVTGEAFKDSEELGRILARERAEDVVRSLAEQLLTYALGRGVEYTDRTAVREVVARVRKEGWRFRELILAVCESAPFQRMRDPGAK
jgi:hypothetical protein